MKKFFFLLFGLILLFVTGCSNDKNSSDFHSEIDLHSNAFNGELETFNDQFEDTNQYKIDLKIKVDEQEEQVSMNVQLDKMYIEVLENNNRTIITKEGDAYFSYIINDKDVYRTYMGNYSDSQISSDYGLNYTELINSDFDINKLKVSKYGDTYKVEATYGDYLGNKNVDAIKNLYNYYGLSIDSLFESKLTMYFTFLDNGIHFNMLMPIDLTDLDPSLEIINVDYEMKIICENFEVIDIFSGEYNISQPKNPYEVYETSELDSIKTSTLKDIACFQVYLEKGVLVSNLDYEDSIYLYDSKKELVNPVVFSNPEFKNHPDIKNMHIINKTGLYYVSIGLNNEKEIDLENYKYSGSLETSYDMSDNTSVLINFDGKYDYCKLKQTLKGEVIKITNNGSTTVNVFSIKGESYCKIEPNDFGYIPNTDVLVFPDVESTNINQVCNTILKFDSFDTDIYVYDKVKEIKDIGNFKFNTYGTFYTYLNKGHYLFDTDECIIEISYDMGSKWLTNSGDYVNKKNILRNYFELKEDGYYLISFRNGTTNHQVSINELKFDTMCDFDNPYVIGIDGSMNNGTIEGYMDLEKYKIVNNDKDTIKIFNVVNYSSTPLYIFVGFTGSKEYVVLEPNEKFLMSVYSNSYKELFVTHNVEKDVNHYLYDYSFALEEVDLSMNSRNNEVKDIELLTTEYSEKLYYIGYGYNYVRLKVELDNVTSFDILDEEGNVLDFRVYDVNGVYIEASENLKILKTGTYIIDIYQNVSMVNDTYSKLKIVLRD